MRSRPLLAALLGAAAALAACDDGRPAGASPDAATARASAGATPASLVAAHDDVLPTWAPDDSAVAAVERYLALSLVDAPTEAGEAIIPLLGCAMPPEPELPAELLAAYEVSGRGARGDTAIVRARVVTVAEQDRRRGDGALTARQRVRDGEWEWDVVRQDGAWRVCTGPRFGFVGDAAATAWRTEGESLDAARALAADVRAGRRP